MNTQELHYHIKQDDKTILLSLAWHGMASQANRNRAGLRVVNCDVVDEIFDPAQRVFHFFLLVGRVE